MMKSYGGGQVRPRRTPQRRMFRGDRKMMMPGGPQSQEPDYFAQFNAWQDPNIGGQQPGPIQAGYGGFGAMDTMGRTKMNDFLNTLSTGGEREQAMNALGYFNSGNPYTPQVPGGYNRGLRATARGNQESGAYGSPGIYQHQTPGATAGNYDWGGYTGVTNVDPSGAAQYTPFDRNRSRGRVRRRGGTVGMYGEFQ